MEKLGTLLSGVGFFFFGLYLINSHLHQAGGRGFRRLLTKVTDRTWLSCLMGVLAGAITQSASAVAIILGGMTASGYLGVRQALPIVAWANVGVTILIFITLFDIRLAVLYLLGISAVAFSFQQRGRWRMLIGVLLGVSLLLYGLDTMKKSGQDFQELEWFRELWARARDSFELAFVGGLALSFVTQSTNAVILLGLGLAHSGLLGAEATAMVIYGAHLGSTLARMLLGAAMKGSSRQVSGFQDVFKITGSVVFVSLFYIEVYAQAPLALALARAASSDVETQMTLVNLLYSVSLALGFTLAKSPTLRLLKRLWPSTAAESLGNIQYLDQQALDFPETALDLVEKEQLRLVLSLPDFLAGMTEGGLARDDAQAKLRATDELHRSFHMLAAEIDAYAASLADRAHSRETSERLINVQSRQSLIEFLEEAAHNIVTTIRETPPTPQLVPLVHSFAEALDFLLRTAADAAGSVRVEDADMLVRMCADRGDLMGRIRTMHLAAERNLGQADKALLLALTTLFERTVWMVKRFGKLLHTAAMQHT